MTKLEAIKLILTVISGTCWTVVYVEGIRVGFRDRSYAIPFYALALNIAWELLHTVFGFQSGVSVQTIINAIWFACESIGTIPETAETENTRSYQGGLWLRDLDSNQD